MARSTTELNRVFGSESKGNTEEARAASSHKIFVRSQVQLGEDNDRATGHRISALEAYCSYGWDVLQRVAEEGAVPLVQTPAEPADTLKKRRLELNLTTKQVAGHAGLDVSVVETAEMPGKVSRIRDLEKMAQALALNEDLLGVKPGAGGDATLGVRLREISQAQDAQRFSPSDVLNLAEAAWVISTQSKLARLLNEHTYRKTRERFEPDADYKFPTYERGYALATRTRQLLNIGENEPIKTIKRLVEGNLGIPIVQQQLGTRFAGATIANGQDRGIVVNERGQNANVWVRRMTVAHELGHLLWDPEASLNTLRVDRYDDVQTNERGNNAPKDPVEIRANAFAIGFLAPNPAVAEIVRNDVEDEENLSDVMQTLGISATAAKYHIWNVTSRDMSSVRKVPLPSAEWIAAENMTVDWFPLKETPISRRGRFALLVVQAFRKGLISGDTGAGYLCTTEDAFRKAQSVILQSFPK